MGSYDVNEGEAVRIRRGDGGWCGTRFLVLMAVIVSIIIYLIGSVITGITYRNYSHLVNCTLDDLYTPTIMYVYSTPLVVVGPCFMSAGGSILAFLLIQWFFCRPLTRD